MKNMYVLKIRDVVVVVLNVLVVLGNVDGLWKVLKNLCLVEKVLNVNDGFCE